MLAHSESLPRPLRIVVVEDHALTRQAVAALLQKEYPLLEVVAATGRADEVLTLVRGHTADLVLLDLDLGDASGFELIPALRQAGVAVVVLTASDDPQDRAGAFRAGVEAYVCKLSPAVEIVTTVLQVGRSLAGRQDNCPIRRGSSGLGKKGEISTAAIDSGFIE